MAVVGTEIVKMLCSNTEPPPSGSIYEVAAHRMFLVKNQQSSGELAPVWFLARALAVVGLASGIGQGLAAGVTGTQQVVRNTFGT